MADVKVIFQCECGYRWPGKHFQTGGGQQFNYETKQYEPTPVLHEGDTFARTCPACKARQRSRRYAKLSEEFARRAAELLKGQERAHARRMAKKEAT
jgi:hypothetical protein